MTSDGLAFGSIELPPIFFLATDKNLYNDVSTIFVVHWTLNVERMGAA